MISYVKIRSWHVIRLTRSIDFRTLCGRSAGADALTDTELPAEKSCESCLRILAKNVDRGL